MKITSQSTPILALSCFFFSSRRRHTRLQGDWSSDVCSSDLALRRVLGVRDRLRPLTRAHDERVAAVEHLQVGEGHETEHHECDEDLEEGEASLAANAFHWLPSSESPSAAGPGARITSTGGPRGSESCHSLIATARGITLPESHSSRHCASQGASTRTSHRVTAGRAKATGIGGARPIGTATTSSPLALGPSVTSQS